ncbi:MAG: UDP-N-acetylglucosamine 2-epimerase, partial [Longimicrobiales bacterium]
AALRDIADAFEDATLLYPVHPNPNVRAAAGELLAGHPRIMLTEPLDYLDLVHALRHAALAITDSGGIQEEAPSFGTPVLVMREVTERPEAVEAGVAQLVGTDRARIVEAASAVLRNARRLDVSNPYGDGRAGERIADIVLHEITGAPRTTQDWQP